MNKIETWTMPGTDHGSTYRIIARTPRFAVGYRAVSLDKVRVRIQPLDGANVGTVAVPFASSNNGHVSAVVAAADHRAALHVAMDSVLKAEGAYNG